MLKKSKMTFSERHAVSRRRYADAANKLRLRQTNCGCAVRRAQSMKSTGLVGPLVFLVEKTQVFNIYI
jgi:hypothetical protein